MFSKKARVVVVLTLIAVGVAHASVPPMVSYQGKLMQPSGAPVPDGPYSIQFAIYDVPTGGSSLWSETNANVQVKGGLFSVLLGSVINLPSNIFDNPNRFFGVKVGADPEMTPRQQIASSAFAFRSATAGSVDDGTVTTPKLAAGAVTADKLAPGVAIPPGTILMWSGAVNQVPQGWALCDGTNGTPDLGSKFIVGVGGVDSYPVGATGGEKMHQLMVAEMPSHGHGVNDPGHAHGYLDWNLNLGSSCIFGNGNAYQNFDAQRSTQTATTGITIQNAGGDKPFDKRPPYYALCFIMKLGY